MSTKIQQLTVAQRIEIQVSGLNVPARFQTEFVGAVKNRWFIVAMPEAKRYGELREHLHEGVPLIVRFVLENENGEICAFRTDIDFVVAHPTKMLFLDWPTNLESRVIRQGRRFDAYLPCKIERFDDNNDINLTADGVILDVSETGCRVKQHFVTNDAGELEKGSWESGQRVQVTADQKNNGEVTIGCIVRQIKSKPDHCELGLQFNRNQQEAINSLFSGSLVDINALSRSGE
ncbi:flagellar brake protein [Idiomarina seosinensis]|uniref:flagellar brake domain-containing protein n=1 Tax=Idiomarina seosinensis TaxID=281739 RepID=UPI003850667E